LRGLVNRAFVSRQVERLAPRIEALANELIDGFSTQGTTELISAYATPIAVRVIAELIGAPVEMAPRLLDWSHRMVAMYQFGASRAVEDSAAAAAQEIAQFVRDLARQRRREPADDLISRLIESEGQGGRLTEDELISTCVLLLNAGHEATVHGVGNGVKAILENDAGQEVAGAGQTRLKAWRTNCFGSMPRCISSPATHCGTWRLRGQAFAAERRSDFCSAPQTVIREFSRRPTALI